MGLGFDHFLDSTFLLEGIDGDSAQSAAYERLREVVFASDGPSADKEDFVQSWLKCPFIPRHYDLEVIGVLIQVFRRHTNRVFDSFVDFVISPDTLPAQLIAMAAVGALFTDCVGSETIAKLYYTDSQRMLVPEVLDNIHVDSLEHSTSVFQTYVALEIFGLCSGHKRSVEISEAYHSAMVQALETHQAWLTSCEPASDAPSVHTAVLQDFLIVQGYRATLLQLQPILLGPHVQLLHDSLARLENEDSFESAQI